MQGQRGTVGSVPEFFNFDPGSSSSNDTTDPQICWNNMRNQVEIGLPDCMLPGDRNDIHMNPVGHEQQNLTGWGIGDPSSRNPQLEPNLGERKVQSGWSSSVDAFSGAGTSQGPRLEDRRFEPTGVLSLNNIHENQEFMQSANSGMVRQGLNLNETIVGHGGDNCPVIGYHNLYKSIGPENEQLPSGGGSDSFFICRGCDGFVGEDNDSRAGSSLEGQRVSCKRKAVEGNVGQFSASGSASNFQHAERSVQPPISSQCNMDSVLSISAPSEQLNSGLGVGVTQISSESALDWARVGNAEGSQRNFSVRINPSNQQDPILSTYLSTTNAVRLPSGSSSHQSRPFPMNQSLDITSTIVIDDTNPQNQFATIQVPVLSQNEQPFRWNGSSSSRTARSSNSSVAGNRETVSGEEAWSRNIPRHILEHPSFLSAHAMGSLVHNPTDTNLTGQNTTVTGDVVSTSRIVSSSAVHPLVASSFVSGNDTALQALRRLRESSVRSVSSSTGSELGGQNVVSTSRFGLSSAVHPLVAPSLVSDHNPPSRSLRRLPESLMRSLSSSAGSEHGGRNAVSTSRIDSSSAVHPLVAPSFVSGNDALQALRRLRESSVRSVSSSAHSELGGQNVVSTSRIVSSSAVHPFVAPSLVSDHNPPSRSLRRLPESFMQSVSSSAISELGGQSRNHSPLLSGLPPPSSQDMAHPSGHGNPVHHYPYPRLTSLTERHGDNVLGFPHSLRALASGTEGRRRLASEIRNMLDLMRGREGLRIEDLLVLEVADIYDRHRDMRLDVDNMTYEELLALEESIGYVSTGLHEKTILSRLKQRKYSIAAGAVQTEVDDEACCVCQEKYSDGEDVGTLECGHDFHRDCIKQWLKLKNVCPICKAAGLST